MTAPASSPDHEADWPRNYFNYFTEVEEHFQRARCSGLFLLSPLDWALLENWKNAGVPLGAVLKGIDSAFEKWRSRKQKRRQINSIAYCAQAVMEAAQRTPMSEEPSRSEAPFQPDELKQHLRDAAIALRDSDSAHVEIATALDELAAKADEYVNNLEDLERRLSALEEKMVAIVRTRQTDADLYALRTSLDADLRPYRGKMTADQLAMLERRYLDSALLARASLPRLSLFYLR
jgi:hypothetical protein